MAYVPLIKVVPQFFDSLGDPLVGGTLNAYVAGSTTPTNMFSDNAGTVAGTSVTLDSRGEPTTIKLIWISTAVTYKFILKDSSGTTIWTIDNIVPSDLVDGSVTAAKLANDSVTTSKIANNAVTTVKILDANVTTAKIADLNVTTGKLAANAVTTAKIADSNVTTAKIADANVTTIKIGDGNVTTAKILDENVTTAKIANANVTPAKLSQPFTVGTSTATTSGTTVPYASIPSWVRRITMIFNGVSTNGTSNLQVQIGTGGTYTTSGYVGASADGPTLASSQFTTGFGIRTAAAAATVYGSITIYNVTGNTWVASGNFARGDSAVFITTAGGLSLGGTLDCVRLTTVNGTDAFDAGSVNIMYE